MNPLYNFGIRVYAGGAKIMSSRSEKIKEMLHGQRRTLTSLENRRKEVAPDGFDIWIHAASLGEFEQGRPLIERLRREHPEKKILLTFFSPSGYRVRKDFKEVDAVEYIPFDTPRNVSLFLDSARPKMAIFVKYEFWGNYLEELERRRIPTYIISAIYRPGQLFFRPWGGMFRKMLSRFTHQYVQDSGSKELLDKIGIKNVTVAGDTRFDRVSDILNSTKLLPEIEKFVGNGGTCIVAGSTWPPDEEILVPWLNGHPDVKAVIAPHEFNPERLDALEKKIAGKVCRMTDIQVGKADASDAKVILVDCFGLLSSIYRYGKIAYVGGGFGAGIHNINEAAVYGIPVVFGPRYGKFKEAADLIGLGAGFSVDGEGSFLRVAEKLLSDAAFRQQAGEAAGRYIKDNLGATDRIYNDLFVE